MRAYEGLFLVDEGKATDDLKAVTDHIRSLLERHGATIAKLQKWDTHRLAYEIKGKRRGTYILSKFEADPVGIAALRHDCQLSNIVLRALILKEEHIGESLTEAEEARRLKRLAQEKPKTEEAPEPEKPQGAPEAETPAEEGQDADILGDAGDLEVSAPEDSGNDKAQTADPES